MNARSNDLKEWIDARASPAVDSASTLRCAVQSIVAFRAQCYKSGGLDLKDAPYYRMRHGRVDSEMFDGPMEIALLPQWSSEQIAAGSVPTTMPGVIVEVASSEGDVARVDLTDPNVTRVEGWNSHPRRLGAPTLTQKMDWLLDVLMGK